MSTWQVTERASGTVVYAYTADEAVDWPDYPFAAFNHNLEIPTETLETTAADPDVEGARRSGHPESQEHDLMEKP